MSRRPPNRRGPQPQARRNPDAATSGTSPTSSRAGRPGRRATSELEAGIERYAALKGTLAQGPDRLLEAFRLSEDARPARLPRVVLPVAQLRRGPARQHRQRARQQVQMLFARWKQAESWFNPELLQIPLETVRAWMDATPSALALYRFAIEDLYRQQEHVLDEAGERLMSLSSRLASSPSDAYWALSTADAQVPDDHAVDRRARSRSRTASTARSSRRGASRRIAQRRSRRCTTSTSATSTPTRRSTTASASATGSRRARAATRGRSKRRCTATTSRPRSSRT